MTRNRAVPTSSCATGNWANIAAMNAVTGGSQRTTMDSAVVLSGRLSALRKGWRVVRTGLAFVAFGIGALVIGLLVTPLLRLSWPRHPDLQRKMQFLIHHAFRLFA